MSSNMPIQSVPDEPVFQDLEDQSSVGASRAERRASKKSVRRDSQARSSGRSRRGRERHLSVRGELRATPDVRKIARAVIQIALAQAEADAQATQAQAAQTGQANPTTSDEASS